MTFDIGEWLRSIGLEQYETSFRDNAIDSDVLTSLSAEDLKEIGVVAIGHRRRLINAIADLAEETSPAEISSETQFGARRRKSENRQLTIVFCDLAESTRLSDILDAEDLQDVITSYQNEVTRIIEKYDGFVARYIGDGILAFFGWPQAHENDAERAVRASLEVNEQIDLIENAGDQKLFCRIGIATGSVVVGDSVGKNFAEENQVVGRTPNIAARIQSLAEPGTVVVSSETMMILGRQFVLQNLGAHDLKGISEPIGVWRVDGVQDSIARFAARDRDTIYPLVNRKRELESLKRLWGRAHRNRGKAVLICGEPGIGKSRLVDEIRQHATEGGALVLRYQCSEFHSSDALFPILSQLRQSMENTRSFSENEKTQFSRKLIEEIGIINENFIVEFTSNLNSYFNSKSPVNLDARGRKEKLFQNLLSLFEKIVDRHILLFIYEDLHWADPTTFEFLRRLIDQLRNQKVLALFTSRPGLDMEWTDGMGLERIELARLTVSEVGEIINSITGELSISDEFRNLIAARTDGVPLFAEELTKSIVESGVVQANELGTENIIDDRSIPITLRDSFIARVDRLPDSREFVQVASAIGREFDREVLEQVISGSVKQFDASLLKLVNANIIIRDNSAAGQFAFKHALMRDAIYESMLRKVRAGIHERIAIILEAKHLAHTPPHVLGNHWALSNNHAKAAVRFAEAASIAKSQYANKEAATYYRETLSQLDATTSDSLDVYSDLPSRQDLLVELSGALFLIHDVDGAANALREAIKISGTDRLNRAKMYRLLGNTLQQDLDAALEALDKAEAVLSGPEHGRDKYEQNEWIEIQLCRLNVHYWSGHGKTMAELASKISPYMDKASPEQRAEYFNQLVLRDLRNYRYSPTETTTENAKHFVEAAGQTNNLAIIASALFIRGFTYLHYGELKEAVSFLRRGLAAARKSGHRIIELRCLSYLAMTYRRKHDVENAVAYARESLNIAHHEKMSEYIALAIGNLAWADWQGGAMRRAKLSAEKAVNEFKRCSIAFPFRWTAMLPLIATNLEHGDLKAVPALCERMSNSSQQQLPDRLNAMAEKLASTEDSATSDQLEVATIKLVEEARQTGFL